MNLVGDYPIDFFASVDVNKLSKKLIEAKDIDEVITLVENNSISSNKLLSDLILEDFSFIPENEKIEIDASILESILGALTILHTTESEADFEEGGSDVNRDELDEAIGTMNDLIDYFNFNMFNLSISVRR